MKGGARLLGIVLLITMSVLVLGQQPAHAYSTLYSQPLQAQDGIIPFLENLFSEAVSIGTHLLRAIGAISLLLSALRLAYVVFLPADGASGFRAIRYLFFHLVILSTLFFVVYNVPLWLSVMIGLKGSFGISSISSHLRINGIDLGGIGFVYDITAIVYVFSAYVSIGKSVVNLAVKLIDISIDNPPFERAYIEFIKDLIIIFSVLFLVIQFLFILSGWLKTITIK